MNTVHCVYITRLTIAKTTSDSDAAFSILSKSAWDPTIVAIPKELSLAAFSSDLTRTVIEVLGWARRRSVTHPPTKPVTDKETRSSAPVTAAENGSRLACCAKQEYVSGGGRHR